MTSTDFYPRPPRGGRHVHPVCPDMPDIFLSTPSARRATSCSSTAVPDLTISIHALREEGDCLQAFPFAAHKNFYPRPPRGGRHTEWYKSKGGKEFLSTPSARRATKAARLTSRATRISIHALREEGDAASASSSAIWANFYPRPPRGGRHAVQLCLHQIRLFLSTPSARRATHTTLVLSILGAISIHALREEGDSKNRDKISIFKQIIQHSARI